MDTARYLFALLAIVSMPAAILYWFILHPFVGFWRRVGKTVTFVTLAIAFIAIGVTVYLVRNPILAVDYGTNRWLWMPAIVCYGVSVWISIRIRSQLTFRVLSGVPELDADGKGGTLLKEGLYARVRHPRYTAVIVGTLAFAFFTNYLAMYLLVPVTVLGLALIVRLEERELEARFGDEYRQYRARVPMFFPRPTDAD